MQDLKPYEQDLWHKPAAPSGPSLWRESTGDFPEPLYRLRLSVLNNNEGDPDCPIQIFVFPSLQTLETAATKIDTTFGGAFSRNIIEKRPVDMIGEVTEDGEMENVEDGRTENILIKFDSQTADERWEEFLTRLNKVEQGWTAESLS